MDGLPRDSLGFAKRCAQLLDEKKLSDISVFEVTDSIQITDYFVLGSGMNSRHLRAGADHLLKVFREQGIRHRGLEGYREGGWVLIDFDDVIVHLFLREARRHYDLELLWGDSPRVEWVEKPSAAS